MKLGVFDSGIGGEAVAAALQITYPEATIIIVNDKAHVPYGDKSARDVIRLTDTAIQPLLDASCDVIILACNTATTLAIEPLRTKYPRQKFIGIEPMIKTAASLTKTTTIAVCATPATLSSDRYRKLIKKYGPDLNIIEPDCSAWANMIEKNEINHEAVTQVITDVCDRGADVIVLGCTHYHWIKDDIIDLAHDNVIVLEPSEAIGRRVQQLLAVSN